MKHYLDMKYGNNAPILRQTNKQAIAVIDEYFKGEPVDIEEPEPLNFRFTEPQLQGASNG